MSIFSKDSTVPWYRARLFWGVIFGLMLAWSVFFYSTNFPHGRPLLEILQYMLDASGGALFVSLGKLISNTYGVVLAFIFYFLFVTATLKFTFRKTNVILFYPIIFVAQFLIGNYIIFKIIVGLN